MREFTNEEVQLFADKCDQIGAKDLDGSLDEKQLRQSLYRLGTLMYRSYHDAGKPEDITQPSIAA